MLAHYLWERTPHGAAADEGILNIGARPGGRGQRPAFEGGLEITHYQRTPRPRAGRGRDSLYSEETAAAVGIKRSSIGKALESLIANADVIQDDNERRLTDPMFELWLRTRGLTRAAGDDEQSD